MHSTTEAAAKQSPISTTRAGVAHPWSRTLIPTAKEAPSDAESPSHQLLARGGYIRRVGAGIYDYLPLAWRVLKKISEIVRQEIDAGGGSEMLMPALCPTELLKETGRADDYGDLLFRFEDRVGRDSYLGPTHEEVITDLMRGAVSSYKQLPLNLYQIQTKFRDEARPRAGLLRCREFIMKDAYSFHTAIEGPGGLNEAYDAMYRAYVNIFQRCGLDFTVVEAEAGPIGGSASHEFMVNCASGEDTILVCPASGYAANVEKCEIGKREWSFEGEPLGDLVEVHTPNSASIEDVSGFMKVKPRHILKTIVFMDVPSTVSDGEIDEAFRSIKGEINAILEARPEARVAIGVELFSEFTGHGSLPEMLALNDAGLEERIRVAIRPVRKLLAECRLLFAVVRGDHEVNEGKLKPFLQGRLWHPLENTLQIMGIPVGFVGPHFALKRPKALVLIDPDAAQSSDVTKGKPYFWVAGANERDHHVKNFNWQRELGASLTDTSKVRVADIRNAVAGDPSPRAPGAFLEAKRGIEVGHIFKLGVKYSKAMGFNVLNDKQEREPVIMGCYGIGVSRTMAACVEMSHDENGIIWPVPIAPYHVIVIPMDVKPGTESEKVTCKLSRDLAAAGFDVLVDDRDERPGVKFKDADLIGIPLRIVIGDKGLAQGSVEFKARTDTSKGEMVKIEDAVKRCLSAAG